MLTFDSLMSQMDGRGNARGVSLGRCVSHDGKVYDSTGAFLNGELERLDQTYHGPLVSTFWARDIDLREDATIADEVTSFTISTFASAGSLGTGNSIGNGKAWIGKNTTQMTGVDVDLAKITYPFLLWGMELKYTIPELESAAKLGRPVDQQKYDGLQTKYQMDVDEQVYIGDTASGALGLINNTGTSAFTITPTNVPAGATGSTLWNTKSPDEILADFNLALTTVWANCAWAVMPSQILIPPAQYGQLSTQKVSLAGNVSVLQYVLENNLLARQGGKKLEIYPLKWAIGAGAGGTIGTTGTVDRMIVYSRNKNHVRFPLTSLQRTPIQYEGIWHKTAYFGRLGQMEVVYPQTIGYFDGI